MISRRQLVSMGASPLVAASRGHYWVWSRQDNRSPSTSPQHHHITWLGPHGLPDGEPGSTNIGNIIPSILPAETSRDFLAVWGQGSQGTLSSPLDRQGIWRVKINFDDVCRLARHHGYGGVAIDTEHYGGSDCWQFPQVEDRDWIEATLPLYRYLGRQLQDSLRFWGLELAVYDVWSYRRHNRFYREFLRSLLSGLRGRRAIYFYEDPYLGTNPYGQDLDRQIQSMLGFTPVPGYREVPMDANRPFWVYPDQP